MMCAVCSSRTLSKIISVLMYSILTCVHAAWMPTACRPVKMNLLRIAFDWGSIILVEKRLFLGRFSNVVKYSIFKALKPYFVTNFIHRLYFVPRNLVENIQKGYILVYFEQKTSFPYYFNDILMLGHILVDFRPKNRGDSNTLQGCL